MVSSAYSVSWSSFKAFHAREGKHDLEVLSGLGAMCVGSLEMCDAFAVLRMFGLET